jgi:two-component system, cell cycle sensor histidine kinase and response regulator CckA
MKRKEASNPRKKAKTGEKNPADKELTILNRLTKAVTAQLSLQETCNAALEQTARALKLQVAVLFLREGGELHLKAVYPASSYLQSEAMPLHIVGECLCGLAVQTGKMIFSQNIHKDRRCTLTECKKAGLHSFAAIPLVLGRQHIGVLGVASSTARNFRQSTRFLKTAADHLSISINNAKLFEQARDYAVQLEQQIREREEADEAMRRERQFSETLLESLPGLFYLYDFDIQTPANSRLIRFNRKHSMQTGYTPEELQGMKIKYWFGPDVLEEAIRAISLINERGESQSNLKLRMKDGSQVPYAFTGRMLNMDDKIYFLGMGIDISDFVRAEEALRFSEEKYKLVVENANDGIFIVQNETIKFPNRKTIEVTGYSEDELASAPFPRFLHPDDQELVVNIHRRRLQGEAVPSTYSFRIVKKSGEVVWIEASVVLVTWEGSPAALTFLRDITIQKRLEEQLLHARKMEAIGTLAGGVAHDFNNLLMGILGYTSLMLIKTDKTHPFHEKLKTIEQLVESGSELTRQLLGFARSGKYEVKPINVNDLIIKTADIFGRTKKEITIHKKLQEELHTMEADRGQIEQVLFNLYVNAWQAMPSGGNLYLETQNVFLDEQYCLPYDITPGAYIKIAVTDTGVGMDDKTQKRIFEPFFSTKGVGKGTGLGLASAYGIIRNHKGIINVYSEQGHGTTFSMYVPASDRDAAETKTPEETLLTGDETILIVDDEPANTEAVKELLEILGYKAETARNGQEAVGLYTSHKGKFDLVILDMIMPGMNGRETFEKLKEIDQNVKVLLSSGYSIDGEAKDILELGCKGFIQKPFRVEEISRKIRDVLDSTTL